MPQIDISGSDSKLSCDKLQGQSGTTVNVLTGHTLAVADSAGLTLAGVAVNAGSLGKVLQMVSTTSTFSGTAISSTDNTWTSTSVLITFTPLSSTSKFLVHFGIGASITSDADDGGYSYRTKKVQSATTTYPALLSDDRDGGNNHSRRYFYSSNVSSVNNWHAYDTFSGVDADAHTTASMTYTIEASHLNLGSTLSVGNSFASRPQIIVMEVEV
jgi:hypothetical protein